jgi:hypothetical protein
MTTHEIAASSSAFPLSLSAPVMMQRGPLLERGKFFPHAVLNSVDTFQPSQDGTGLPVQFGCRRWRPLRRPTEFFECRIVSAHVHGQRREKCMLTE